ncbi:type I restriction enzyme S subunit [Thermonema lapsum]|uniref:Type I restriction enzyme S subunit n=1 Tax=Thermonema lapsum TaxID=28195 RepID=A0A846MR62_9BACT|nr:restriction endonuclease subunit S [Thermonema lapsum]NIK73862.1 type I restriction enzyme S subunit [Thermonema lapsum]
MKTHNDSPRIPRLRFPEFQNAGEWEVKKLGEVANFLKGRGISKSDINNNGTQPCIRYGELYTHYNEVIKEIKSFTNLNGEGLILSEPNDVIIPSSGETKEEIATASCVKLGGVALGGDLNILRSSLVNGEFLAYYLSHGLKKTISKIAQGDTVVHLYAAQLKKLTIRVPKAKEEQEKIAACLSSLNEVIAGEREKLALLQQHKKGLLQQLFPQEGETVPKLRFKEFEDSGEWDYFNGDKLFEPIVNKNHNSDLPILAITQEHGAIPREMIDYHVSVTDRSIESYKVVEVGDFIISLRSFQGGIEYSKFKGLCSPAYVILRKKTELENDFYRHYFKTTSFIQDLNKNLQGIRDGKMISYKQFSEILIPFPSLPEQQKIAACLSSLDDLIAAQTEKIELLEQHKKGLVQGLFPVGN